MRLSRRQIALGTAVVLVGAGLIAWGWLRAGTTDYLPAFLLEVGAALLLAVPLLAIAAVLGRRIRSVEDTASTLDERVQTVEEDVRKAGLRLDELDDAVASRLAESRRAREGLVDAVHDEVSLDTITELLTNATRRRAISPNGVRVALDHVSDRIRLRTTISEPPDGELTPSLWINLEDAAGTRLGVEIIWSQGETVADAWERLVGEAQARNRHPGDAILAPGQVVGGLVGAVARSIRARDDATGGVGFDPVIELFPGGWALTDGGLEHLDPPQYTITVEKVLDDEHILDHMLDKNWVDPDSFRDALRVAQAYHDRRRKAVQALERSRMSGVVDPPW